MPRYVSGSGAADLVKIQAESRYISGKSTSTSGGNLNNVDELDLNKLNINNPTNTYDLNVSGNIGLTGDIYNLSDRHMLKVNNYGQTFF